MMRRAAPSPPRSARGESGQMMPVYLLAIIAIAALGALLLQVGLGASLRTDAQTAADSAALAGAEELASQLYSNDGSAAGLSEDAVRAAAEDYASQNGSEVTDFEMNACGISLTVATEQELEGEDAAEAGVEGDSAVADAAAAMGSSAMASSGVHAGPFGSPADGSVPPTMQPAAQLAAQTGLQVTSTTGGTHAPGSFHYQGLAIDVSGDPAAMAAFYRAAQKKFSGRVVELFYDPIGWIDSGQVIPSEGGHTDHVHIALAPEGAPRVPDAGGVGSSAGVPFVGGGTALAGTGTIGPQLVTLDSVDECTLGSASSLLAGSYSSAYTPSAQSDAIARGICKVGEGLDVSNKIMLAAFETAIVESGVQNLPGGDRDSAGVFQQRPSVGEWGTYEQVTDLDHAATRFFETALEMDSGESQTPGQLAQAVQRSAFPERYDQAEGEALGLMRRVGCRA